MGWWHRDPTLVSHSPIHRYAQRVLRDHEAALRTRCFSKSSGRLARLENNDPDKRPEGMSNLEWMQLQRYRRWTKRLRDDPYNAIFGASNDMLNGKGLQDWQWIYKSFPKWMLQEVDPNEGPPSSNTARRPGAQRRTASTNEHFSTSEDRTSRNIRSYRRPTDHLDGNNPRIENYASTNSNYHLGASRYAPRSDRPFERDTSSGITAPSDLRRPRDEPHVRIVGDASNISILVEGQGVSQKKLSSDSITLSSGTEMGYINKSDSEGLAKKERIEQIKREASAREASFIDAFFADPQPSTNALTHDKAVGTSWRQTALQRRKDMPFQSRPHNALSSVLDLQAKSASDVDVNIVSIPSTQATHAILGDQASEVRSARPEPTQQPDSAAKSTLSFMQKDEHTDRSAPHVLEQLPKEDIDFLSAADIRASMGTRRSKVPSDDIRAAERARLENTFVDKMDNAEDMDSMVQAQILNNQHIRRKTRELHEAQKAAESAASPSSGPAVANRPAIDQPVESSIDRMKRWLETTGANFAKQFWQDPTEAADITQSKLFFDKAYNYIRKGRSAMRPIVDDLENDVPASKSLLGRLKKDEDRLELAVHRLRQRSSDGALQGLSPRKIKAMESIKINFHQTNIELEKAHAKLQELSHTAAVINAPESLKRRLVMASKVLHKNTQLSRMLVYSIQTRLEDPKIDRSVLPSYKLVADDLLSLRDTQIALMRLVDHAILVYGASPRKTSSSKASGQESTSTAGFEGCEEPFVRARLAADAHLINEIKAHKSVIQDMSDDGHMRQQKTTASIVLDEPKPLAHSLYRPFTPVFESLGSQAETEAAAQKAKEARDAKLVTDVRNAYEDMYGAITVDHRQIILETEPQKSSDLMATKRFEMLKEDPTANASITLQAVAVIKTPQSAQSMSKDDVSTPEISSLDPKVEPTFHPQASTSSAEDAASNLKDTSKSVVEAASTTAASSDFSELPTHYTILIYDQHSENFTTTTSTSGPPRDLTPCLPIHQALAILDVPSKFVPHITEGLEIVSAKKDMLVLRDSLAPDAAAAFQTIAPTASKIEDADSPKSTLNPIDGTARLSPTGYVGPEESAEQLEKEFKERRDAAGRFHGKQAKSSKTTGRTREEPKKRAGAGIVKTAIWATALCYIVGVFGEIATSPFKA